MAIYDTEEEQVAAIKQWWKENGVSTIAGIAVGIIAIVGWDLWKDHQQQQASQASGLYTQLQASIETKNYDSSIELTTRIAQQHGGSAYNSYAALMMAKVKVSQGDLAAAQTILEKQMKTADSVELRNIARIRLVKVLQARNENEKGLQLISSVDQSKSQGFSAIYDELIGDLYVALDRLGEARTAYQSALRSGSQSRLLQFKLDDISASEVLEN